MVQKRSRLENLSKDELVDEVLGLENFKNDINSKFSELNDRFNNFEAKYKMVNFNLSILKRLNELLFKHITHLELNNLNNAQYKRRNKEKILKLTQCHLILPIMPWKNLCAKRYD